jgi:hypothetical protein
MGFRWKVANGKKIRLWEDLWFHSCSLAIKFGGVIALLMSKVEL